MVEPLPEFATISQSCKLGVAIPTGACLGKGHRTMRLHLLLPEMHSTCAHDQAQGAGKD